MRKSFFAVLLLLCMICPVLAADNEVKFAIGEWAPFVSQSLPDYGVASEIVVAACKEAGLAAVIEFLPWPRCEKNLLDGEAFASYPYAMTDERKEKFLFSDNMFNTESVFFYYVKNPKTTSEPPYEKLEDLKSLKVGGIKSYFYEKEFADAGLDMDYVNLENALEVSIKKLHECRIDLFCDDRVSIYEYIKSIYPDEVDNFKTLSKPFKQNGNYLMVAKTYPNAAELLVKFNEGLKKIQENGKYDEIIKKYPTVFGQK